MKYLFYIAIFNLIGVVVSVLYGIFGGSGGETTAGVFYGVAFTGVVTVFGCAVLPIIQLGIVKAKWYWVLLLIAVGIAEASIIDWKLLL